MVGIHLILSNYPQQPLFWGGGQNSLIYINKYFRLPYQHVPKSVWQLELFKSFGRGAGGIVMGHLVYPGVYFDYFYVNIVPNDGNR